MKPKRRTVVVVAAAAVLGVAAGAGIAQAVSGSEEPLTGPTADRAAEAALEAAGGGTVLEVERQDDDGAGIYEVEVRGEDGSEVEVHLDAQFRQVGVATNDDAGEQEDSSEGGADDD